MPPQLERQQHTESNKGRGEKARDKGCCVNLCVCVYVRVHSVINAMFVFLLCILAWLCFALALRSPTFRPGSYIRTLIRKSATKPGEHRIKKKRGEECPVLFFVYFLTAVVNRCCCCCCCCFHATDRQPLRNSAMTAEASLPDARSLWPT